MFAGKHVPKSSKRRCTHYVPLLLRKPLLVCYRALVHISLEAFVWSQQQETQWQEEIDLRAKYHEAELHILSLAGRENTAISELSTKSTSTYS